MLDLTDFNYIDIKEVLKKENISFSFTETSLTCNINDYLINLVDTKKQSIVAFNSFFVKKENSDKLLFLLKNINEDKIFCLDNNSNIFWNLTEGSNIFFELEVQNFNELKFFTSSEIKKNYKKTLTCNSFVYAVF